MYKNLYLNVFSTHLENIIAFTIQNHDALVKMVMFHRGRRIQNRQWTLSFRLERVIRPSMVEVMA